MPFEYVSRREQLYYIRVAEGKNGKPRYVLTTSRSGQLADGVPDGMEIHEIPETGQTVLRNIRPSKILEIERDVLRQAVERQMGEGLSLVEAEGDSLIVYLSDIETDEPDFFMAVIRHMAHRRRYSKAMRFDLTAAKSRQFTVSRWCFLGAIDDWYLLDGPAPLAKLVRKYVKHLGKESFFDLM